MNPKNLLDVLMTCRMPYPDEPVDVRVRAQIRSIRRWNQAKVTLLTLTFLALCLPPALILMGVSVNVLLSIFFSYMSVLMGWIALLFFGFHPLDEEEIGELKDLIANGETFASIDKVLARKSVLRERDLRAAWAEKNTRIKEANMASDLHLILQGVEGLTEPGDSK